MIKYSGRLELNPEQMLQLRQASYLIAALTDTDVSFCLISVAPPLLLVCLVLASSARISFEGAKSRGEEEAREGGN